VSHKVTFGSIAGVAVMLIGIGGTWVVLNVDTVAAKLLEAGVRFAAKRGVQLPPETVKLVLELSGSTAGAAAGAAGKTAAKTGKQAAGKSQTAGKASAKTGKQAAGKARPTGTGAVRRTPKPARSAS
jgi:hypothetical protein